MNIFIDQLNITNQIKQCEDLEDVGLLYESVVSNKLIGEETQEHRNELNERLLQAMNSVYDGKSDGDTVSFYYTTE